MIQIEDFRVMIMAAYDGYGRTITDKQIKVMHSQLKKFDSHVIKAATRKHLNECSRPPMIADLLKHCGYTPHKSAKTYVCAQCAESTENVYTMGYNDPKQVCSGCFYKVADKAGISALAVYAKTGSDSVKNSAERLMEI